LRPSTGLLTLWGLVFITGDMANEETAATLRRTGAPCVEKPFRVLDFITVVEQTLGKAVS